METNKPGLGRESNQSQQESQQSNLGTERQNTSSAPLQQEREEDTLERTGRAEEELDEEDSDQLRD